MSLPTNNNNQKGKKGNNNKKPGSQGSKFLPKPGKAAGGGSSKITRTGGTRGS